MPVSNNPERIKYFSKSGTSIDMSFEPKHNNFNSYHEWRKACNYNKQQNSRFVDLISSNSKLFKYEQCIEKLNTCLQANITPNDLVIAILYLSCHHFSPHAMKLMRHLLTHYATNIDLYATSISSPQFMIPHIAAMNSDILLLQMYYNLNGNINVKDGRGVLPITIAFAERHLQFGEALFWMNTLIPLKQLSCLHERSVQDVAPFIAALINFINMIQLSKKYICNELQRLDMPNELIDIVIENTLPLDTYNGIQELLHVFENKKSANDWDQIKTMAMQKLNEDTRESIDECIGVNYENNLETIHKMITNIYVKPTRSKKGALIISFVESSNTIKNIFKVGVICSVAIASAIIVWKRYRK